MQELKLADDLFEQIRSGEKKSTIRTGRRAINPGKLKFSATHGTEADIHVDVTKVIYKKLRDLTDAEAGLEGVGSAKELVKLLKSFYPDIEPAADITIVQFNRDMAKR